MMSTSPEIRRELRPHQGFLKGTDAVGVSEPQSFHAAEPRNWGACQEELASIFSIPVFLDPGRNIHG